MSSSKEPPAEVTDQGSGEDTTSPVALMPPAAGTGINFTNHEGILDTVMQHLLAGRRVCLYGERGVGKTTLMAEVVRRLREANPDLRFLYAVYSTPFKKLLLTLARGLHELELLKFPDGEATQPDPLPWRQVGRQLRTLKVAELSGVVAHSLKNAPVFLLLDDVNVVNPANQAQLEELVTSAVYLLATANKDQAGVKQILAHCELVHVPRLAGRRPETPFSPAPANSQTAVHSTSTHPFPGAEEVRVSIPLLEGNPPIRETKLPVFFIAASLLLLLVLGLLGFRAYSTLLESVQAVRRDVDQRFSAMSKDRATQPSQSVLPGGEEAKSEQQLAQAQSLSTKLEQQLITIRQESAKLEQQLATAQARAAKSEQQTSTTAGVSAKLAQQVSEAQAASAKLEQRLAEARTAPVSPQQPADTQPQSVPPQEETAAVSPPARKESPTLAESEPRTPRYYGRGSTGPVVKRIQQRLQELGYFPDPVDGIYGRNTRSAVKAFQKKEGLWVDGVVGRKTLKRLTGAPGAEGGGTTAGADTNSAPSPPARIRYALRSKGPEVERIQRRLQELGHYRGTVDSAFGSRTRKAVKAFQTSEGLPADGMIGVETFNRLFPDADK